MPCLSRVASLAAFSTSSRVDSVALSAAATEKLPDNVVKFVSDAIALCNPAAVHVCDGSEAENQHMLDTLEANGVVTKLAKR